MFVSFGQFYVFFACVAFGGICGVLFSLAAAIKHTFKNVVVKILADGYLSNNFQFVNRYIQLQNGTASISAHSAVYYFSYLGIPKYYISISRAAPMIPASFPRIADLSCVVVSALLE